MMTRFLFLTYVDRRIPGKGRARCCRHGDEIRVLGGIGNDWECNFIMNLETVLKFANIF